MANDSPRAGHVRLRFPGRLGRFWSPLPHQVSADETPLGRLSRWAVAVWYIAEFFFAAIGLVCLSRGEGREERGEGHEPVASPPSAFRPPPSTWLWGLLLVGCLMAAHAVYWTDMRMRAPVMPVVALAAAAGIYPPDTARLAGQLVRRANRLLVSQQPLQPAQIALANKAVHNRGDKRCRNREDHRAISHE